MTDRPGAEHYHALIVPGAKFQVRCLDCRYAMDSAASSGADALREIGFDHDPGHRLEVKAVDYSDHPLHRH